MTALDPSSPPLIIPRPEHAISRKKIDRNALKIMYRLKDHGFLAYLVGGAVRDLLLGRQPADFDIATDATPQQIKRLFRNSRIIGRRFRLAHIFFTDRITGIQQIIEVATFRKEFTLTEGNQELAAAKPTIVNNIYGTPAEDVQRRDFTINALFYALDGFSVIDYLDGLADLRDGIVRVIGDPYERLVEDPVRILRAMEFVCRLGFSLEEKTRAAMLFCAPRLAEVPASRMREELRGLYSKGTTSAMLELATQLNLLNFWLPEPVQTTWAEAKKLLEAIEGTFPLEGDDQLLETLVTTSFILPELINRCHLTPPAPLHEVAETCEQLLQPLAGNLQLPRFQRHRVKELIVGFFRLCSGDKRTKRLQKRADFHLSLFFFSQVSDLHRQELGNIAEFWHKQVRRWPPQKKYPGLELAALFQHLKR
ncbi:MAG: CCA tRNA nucleotidyltransferase [Deltaproteobacteria bacterium]|nr:CCA tRNA nucleotidyltransferase [Candidatus Anaeroferrophillus wilburensis]MBN2889673.1 CCA tRNA nucleotidyltransferase [Deltaproteobacteria bacterium]